MRSASIVAILAFSLFATSANALEHVTTGPEFDYQASVLRSSDDGARIMVFERLNASDFGDLWITRSTDEGENWSDPVAIIATAANERHPALVQTASSQYALFYLKSAGSSYHLWRATSSDGEQFTEQNQLDLGWSSGSEINPRVIRHQDGTLTMSYQRFGGGGGVFVAQSTDDGVTWDPMQTQIASGAQLPRIAFRESDGLYLASYQVGGGDLQMYVKTTTDVRDWSAPRQDFAITGNNHDSLPVVMPDGAFVMFWIVGADHQFDIAARRSTDGVNWGPVLTITDTPNASDVEPYPLVGTSSSEVELYWGRDTPVESRTADIVREPAVVVNDPIFANSFES